MSATTADAAFPGTRQSGFGDFFRFVLRGLGQTFITLGVIILLFVVYELWWTNFGTARKQAQLYHGFLKGVSAAAAAPQTVPPISSIKVGQGIGVIYIPRFGASYHEVIVEGTGYDQLEEGPGHWTKSQYPGQLGNFYVAGHRTTHTAPFNKLAELHDGDNIYIETTTGWYVYELQRVSPVANWQEIVNPNDVSISYQVPDQPNKLLKGHQRLITLSTCNPEFSATSRLVVHGLLIAHHSNADGYRPPSVVNGPLPTAAS